MGNNINIWGNLRTTSVVRSIHNSQDVVICKNFCVVEEGRNIHIFFNHVPRDVQKGGGVGFFIKEDLSFEKVSKNNCQTFESTSIQISTEGAKDVIFHVLYRPPNLSKSEFLGEFGMFLEGAALSGCENILLGDLNFHLDQHDTWTLKFYDLLEQFSFTQLVNTPTHIQGHILDALCVRDSFSWAISPKVIGGLSDHQAIMFSLIFPVRVL